MNRALRAIPWPYRVPPFIVLCFLALGEQTPTVLRFVCAAAVIWVGMSIRRDASGRQPYEGRHRRDF